MATTIEKILGGGSPSSTGRIPGSGQGAVQRKGLELEKMEGAGIRKVQLPAVHGTAGGNAGNAPKQHERITYTDMYKRLNPYQPPTEQELEKERKKQRREQIFAAIGDGISALSNLFFTTQYAPNMYSGRNTASQRTKERWDKLAADRNANMTAYINGLMRAQQADDEYDKAEREWRRHLGLDKVKAERDKAADARAEEEQKWKRELHPFEVREAEGKARTAEAQAENADELEKSKVRRNDAAAGASRASASASYARARAAGGGNKYYGNFRNKDYRTEADYNRAVLAAAKEYGIPLFYEEVTERYGNGKPAKTKRISKSIEDLAAEVANRDAEREEMESYRRGGKKDGNGASDALPPLYN